MPYSETPVTILTGLNRLAYNLWWSWSDNAQRIFDLIDSKLWKEAERNPVVFLKRLSRESLLEAVSRKEVIESYKQVISEFDAYLHQDKTWFNVQYPGWENIRIAYFSAEFGLHESVPIYSGGLGVLAGDHCKAASDLGLPFTAIGLLYRQGYFVQQINKKGQQEAVYVRYNFDDMPLQLIKNISGEDIVINVELPGRICYAKIWKINVGRIPLFLLDSDIDENSAEDRMLTNNLYGGDHDIRISQEILLGMGGVRALNAMGIKPTVWHMNEGHSVFLGLERIVNLMKGGKGVGLSFAEAHEVVKANAIFTTHTPVPAGNDAFSLLMIEKYFKRYLEKAGIKTHEFMRIGLRPRGGGSDLFSLTILAFHFSAQSNGVSSLHGHVSRTIWNDVWHGVPLGEIPIGHITNGVHTLTWLDPSIADLFDRYMGSEWRQIIDLEIWDKVNDVPSAELWGVRNRLKEQMIKSVHHRLAIQSQRHLSNTKKGKSGEVLLNPKALTLGFARRFATYKRATLIFRDMDRLRKILNNKERPVQIIFAGKAHPADKPGQEFIARVYEISQMKEFSNKIVMVEGYDMHLARHLVSGVDIWLNTPRRPYEASGTSGQKAGLNGAVNFSVLDGWWVEGFNDKNGWSIGGDNDIGNEELQDKLDSEDIYEKLENEIVPMYYNRNEEGVPERWMEVVKESIKTILPQFSTARMVRDYFNVMYMPAHIRGERLAEADFDKAKALADWKSWMKSNWEYIKVVSIEKGEHIKDDLGTPTEYYEIIITIDLGPLSPSDVAIEIFKGIMDKKGEFKSLGTIPMKRLGEIWEGFYSYAGIVPSDTREGYGFFFHIVPTHPDLGNKYELGLIRTTYVAADEVGVL
ncbi:MAG: alpha-glucan family phosphorylase [Nitrospirae bacterium]|nr:alpha-glucan family phosphorylase [Nitrospirota bacterium]